MATTLTVFESQTVVKSSSTFVHYNEQIFPDPEVFNPLRWLASDAHKILAPWLVAFSKGPRTCQGIQYELQFLDGDKADFALTAWRGCSCISYSDMCLGSWILNSTIQRLGFNSTPINRRR